MAIRKIARMGHPVLRQKAREVTREELQSPEFARLLQDMVETMEEYGGIGLAAPQIHESISVAFIDYEEQNDRYSDIEMDEASEENGDAAQKTMPLSVFINAKITVLDETLQGFWEGCLSIPELRGLVYRPRKIRVDYWDLSGTPQFLIAEGFLATVFQHELDHISGVLYVDRVKVEPGKNVLSFTEEYSRYLVPREEDDIGELED